MYGILHVLKVIGDLWGWFIVEDLTNIRKTAKPQGRKLRTYLNRWPYAEFLICFCILVLLLE